jgi:hypothetical protein
VASVTATANNSLGSYDVTANVGSLTAAFALTNASGPPASLTATGGTPQSTGLSAAFGSPLQVTVKDASGDLLGGVTVNFTAPTSGASAPLSNSSAAVVRVTNSAGVASVTATANSTPGSYSVTAKAGTLSATFSLTNSALSPCDVNQDGKTNVLDVQETIDEALGAQPAANDLNNDKVVNVVDIQIVIDAALGLGCSAS